MAKKQIGILTGGGDVPGLNSVIKTVTYRSSENDIEVVGLRRGWEALTHLNLEDPNGGRRWLCPWTVRTRAPSTVAVGPCCTRAAPTRPKWGSYPIILLVRTFRVPKAPGTSPSKCWRTSRRWASSTLLPSAVTIRSATRPSSTNLASRSLQSRRRWITTFTTPSTASASRPRSPAPPMPSSASGPPSARTSGSAFSESSAAMPASRRSTRPTSTRSAVSSPNTRSIWTS